MRKDLERLDLSSGVGIPEEVKAVQTRSLQEGSVQPPNNARCLREKLIDAVGCAAALAVVYSTLPTIAGAFTFVTTGNFLDGFGTVYGLEVAVVGVSLLSGLE